MVAGAGVAVCHDDAPVGGDGDAVRAKESLAAVVKRPKGKGQRAVGVEGLDAVVAGIDYDDAPVGGDGDAGRFVKFLATIAERPKGASERAVCVKH